MARCKEAPANLGKIVLADDPVAADATCARLMGFDPLRVRHLSEGAISSATCARTGSGCWRKESEHRRARFPYCQNSDISLRRRARGRTAGESLVRPTASVKQRE